MNDRKPNANKRRDGKLVQLVFDAEEMAWLEELKKRLKCSTLRGTIRLALSCVLKLTGITEGRE